MADTNSSIPTKNSPLEGKQAKSDGVDYPPSDLPAKALVEEGWVETTLGEVCEVQNGYAFKADEFSDSGIYVIKIKNIASGEFILNGIGLYNGDTSKLTNYFVEKGDILVSMTGSHISQISSAVGKVSIYNLEESSLLNQRVGNIKPKQNIDKNYLRYLLIQPEVQLFWGAKAGGSANQANISPNIIKSYRFSLPPLPEQKAIASVLSAFDDKIELLREQNKTLEEMGQTIFKEWFLPSRQAGGKYGVDDLSADKAGELPEGPAYRSNGAGRWRVGKLGEIGQVICGKTPSKGNQEYFGGDIPFIKIPDMHGEVFIIRTEDSLTEFGANTQKNKFIPKNSICVSCIATVGLVSITSRDSQTNQQINSIVPSDKKYLEYLYFVLTNMKNDLLAIGSGGSATLNINTSTFSNIKIVIPNKEILNNFHNTTNSIFTKILDNLYQIQSLARSRDELLPKLMSGAVRVKL